MGVIPTGNFNLQKGAFMKIEDQVISLGLAKRLKALGYEQESLWYWGYDPIDPNKLSVLYRVVTPNALEWYPAYTVAELGEMLPTRPKDNSHMKLDIWRGQGRVGWNIAYNQMRHACGKPNQLAWFTDEKLSDAMAKMLIYLKERDLLQ